MRLCELVETVSHCRMVTQHEILIMNYGGLRIIAKRFKAAE